MKKYLMYLFVFLFTVPTSAQMHLNVDECRKLALQNNKQIAIAKEMQQKSGYDVKAYKANYLPKFSASGTYFYTENKMERTIGESYLPTFVPDASGNLVPNILTTINGTPVFKEYAYMPSIPLELKLGNTYMAGVQLEQPLYTGGKVTAAYNMSKIGENIADLNSALTETEVIVKADEAYWQYVKLQELRKSAKAYSRVVAELYRMVDNSYITGLTMRNDVLKVQVKMNEAELQLRKAENAIRLSRMNLCHILGLPMSADIESDDEIAEPTTNVLPNGANIFARSEYQMLEKQCALKNQQVKLARSEFLPNAGVMAGYGYANGVRLNNERLMDNGSFSVLVSVNIPLFHWGEGKNKVRSAQSEMHMAQLQRDETAELLELDLNKSINEYDEAILELKLTKRSLEQAEENLKVSHNQYEAGTETLVNYMEAQTLWQKAWGDYINSKASVKMNETYYLKSAGLLVDGE